MVAWLICLLSLVNAAETSKPFYLTADYSVGLDRVRLLNKGASIYGIRFTAPDAYLSMAWAGSVIVNDARSFADYICRDAKAQNFSCIYSKGFLNISIKETDLSNGQTIITNNDSLVWSVDPCNGSLRSLSATLSDSVLYLSDSLRCPERPNKTPIRELYVRVSGLSKSSAKKLGVQWNDLIATFANDSFDRLYSAALVASDSVGQLNFARSLTFAVRDSGSLTFGSEYRRPASVINSENGSSVTAYESIFDGLSVDIINDAYKLTYRQSNSVLTVPSFVGLCSVGIADISSDVLQTIPYLSSIPYLGELFTFRQNTSDQLAISVCVEPK